MTRITYGMINDNVQRGIQANAQRVDESMTQLSTGKMIRRPSDDPVGTSAALQLRTQLSSGNQYYRNMEDGLGWLSTTETALGTGNSALQRARELAIQGANDTYGATERQYLVSEVEGILEEVLSIANTSFKGDYIFSGTQTQVPPFSLEKGTDTLRDVVDANGRSLAAVPATLQLYDLSRQDSNTASGNPVATAVLPGSLDVPGLDEGTDYTVDYKAGTITFLTPASQALAASATGITLSFDRIRRSELDLSGEVSREVQKDTVARINVDADAAFGTEGQGTVFDNLIGLMQGLHTNSGAEIREAIDPMDQSMGRFLRAQTMAGSRTNRLQFTQQQNRADNVVLTSESSRVEDVDFSKVISDFQNRQQIYQASIQVGSKIIQPTLGDYL
ncbi:MAG: flagellar hook-associated protein FlgL [Fibrobacteria bacterium]|nr:flagellar hook-associated protein FlgL [Fibrobacteria bacterium]